jgi:thiol-disulfide isomerase/thioredoxin
VGFRALRILAALAALLGLGAVALAGLLLSADRGAAPTGRPTTTEGEDEVIAGAPAPRLAGTDPVTGERARLATFRGKTVVVHVWASWCLPCAEEATALARFAAAHRDAAVLGIDYQDTVSGAKAFYKRFRWRHPSIFDSDGRLAARLGLVDLPTTFFLDRRHRLVTSVAGPATRAELEDGLEEAKRAR